MTGTRAPPVLYPMHPSVHTLGTRAATASQHPSTQSSTPYRRQVFKDIVRNVQAAITPTTEPCKPSVFITVDKACAHPEAKQSVHLGQADPVCVVEAEGVALHLSNDAAVLEPKAVCLNTLEPSAAPEAESTAAALGPELTCAAASPAVMTPKSYAAVAKASVVTAAAPKPAAVPTLSAASVTSTDLKPATASKLAADTTLLKVNICMHTSLKVHVQGACACTFWEAVCGSGGVTDQGRTYLTTQPIRSPSCPNRILTTCSPRSSPHSAGAAKHRGNR